MTLKEQILSILNDEEINEGAYVIAPTKGKYFTPDFFDFSPETDSATEPL